MSKQSDIDELFDEVLRLRKLVEDAWWEGFYAGEDSNSLYRSSCNLPRHFDESESLIELMRKPVK